MCDVVVKGSRSLSHLLMSSCYCWSTFLSRGQLDGCYCPTGNLLNKYVRMFIDIDIIVDIKYPAVAVIQRFNLISAFTR